MACHRYQKLNTLKNNLPGLGKEKKRRRKIIWPKGPSLYFWWWANSCIYCTNDLVLF